MFYLQNVFMYMYIYEDITLTWTFSAKVLKKLWSSLKLKKINNIFCLENT